MKAILLPLILISTTYGAEPTFVFDNRPESGVPQEARARLTNQENEQLHKKGRSNLRELKEGNIRTVHIRYFNKETWKTEAQVIAYVRNYLADKSLSGTDFQIWSQGVGVPEIECFIEFTDEYRKKLREENKPCRTGRLLIWHTESCYRDATGSWWFVGAFNHFHRYHPKGDRKLAKEK